MIEEIKKEILDKYNNKDYKNAWEELKSKPFFDIYQNSFSDLKREMQELEKKHGIKNSN